MMFKLSMWWKDAITKLFLLFSIFQIIVQIYGVYSAFAFAYNPLIPESLAYFASFVHLLLIPLWILGSILFWRYLNNQAVLKNKFWLIPLLMFGLFIGQYILVLLSVLFNPFD